MPTPRHRNESRPASGVTGVVLAGGQSSRFGAPKGLEFVGNTRIVDRVASALQQATERTLCIANDAAARAWLPDMECIPDILPGHGGLSGIHSALTHTRGAVLVVAWDMPFVTGPLLRALAERGRDAGADACVPQSDSPVGMEPFCAWYAPSCLAPLTSALKSGNSGGARFVKSLSRVAWLSREDCARFGDPNRLLFSVNTPEDLARARSWTI